MRRVGEVFRDAGVRTIYLVHGTFTGPDALGILSELRRLIPSLGNSLSGVVKRLIDSLAGDRGNYTQGYARELEQAINARNDHRIAVRLLNWSSENHHIGRADGAIRMIDQIVSDQTENDRHSIKPRVLFWGHSHAGNVFALASNLLSGDGDSIAEFFDTTRCYFAWPLFGWIDIPMWHRVEKRLAEMSQPICGVESIDCVTFGTPIRYGWDTSGIDRLLHIVSHRPRPELPDYRTHFPPSPTDLLNGVDGDYIQQLGIAGTNIMPGLLAWRSWLADHRLDDLLEREVAPDSLLERWTAGRRVPDDGETLLVDYGKPTDTAAHGLAGHAVYTQRAWLLFHAEQVALRLYEDPGTNSVEENATSLP